MRYELFSAVFPWVFAATLLIVLVWRNGKRLPVALRALFTIALGGTLGGCSLATAALQDTDRFETLLSWAEWCWYTGTAAFLAAIITVFVLLFKKGKRSES